MFLFIGMDLWIALGLVNASNGAKETVLTNVVVASGLTRVVVERTTLFLKFL